MKQFDVNMRCVVYKTVTVECETREQAEQSPWEYAVDEQETDLADWTILSVKEND
jgi:hypothetical protein